MAAEQKVPKLSKRMKAVRAKVDRSKAYPIEDALKLVKQTAIAKFDESVDVAVNLGVDAKKSDQTVRGSVVLPAGIGKKVRVRHGGVEFRGAFVQVLHHRVAALGDRLGGLLQVGQDLVGLRH